MTHTPFTITSGFRPPSRPDHEGIDIDTPYRYLGCAPFDGNLVRKNASSRADGRYLSYGYYWRIEHGKGIVTRGAHIREWLRGDGRVLAGEPICELGGRQGDIGAGNARGDSHLHYEYEIDGVRVDPTKHNRMGALFHPRQEIPVGPTMVQWTFLLVYGEPWSEHVGFYEQVRATLKRLCQRYIEIEGHSPVDSPNHFKRFLKANNVP